MFQDILEHHARPGPKVSEPLILLAIDKEGGSLKAQATGTFRQKIHTDKVFHERSRTCNIPPSGVTTLFPNNAASFVHTAPSLWPPEESNRVQRFLPFSFKSKRRRRKSFFFSKFIHPKTAVLISASAPLLAPEGSNLQPSSTDFQKLIRFFDSALTSPFK